MWSQLFFRRKILSITLVKFTQQHPIIRSRFSVPLMSIIKDKGCDEKIHSRLAYMGNLSGPSVESYNSKLPSKLVPRPHIWTFTRECTQYMYETSCRNSEYKSLQAFLINLNIFVPQRKRNYIYGVIYYRYIDIPNTYNSF